jgi:hypothetical protein
MELILSFLFSSWSWMVRIRSTASEIAARLRGIHSVQDDTDSDSWGGQNVFDVYTKSQGVGLDGTIAAGDFVVAVDGDGQLREGPYTCKGPSLLVNSPRLTTT